MRESERGCLVGGQHVWTRGRWHDTAGAKHRSRVLCLEGANQDCIACLKLTGGVR